MKTNHRALAMAGGLAGAAILAFAPPAPNPIASHILSPYVTQLTGQSQGAITGDDIAPDNSGNAIKLAGVQHGITVPFDSLSGMVTGARRHAPFTIVKQIDKTTPQLYAAMVNSENLPTVIVKYYATLTNSLVTNVFTYTLSDARIVSIRNWQPNANDPASAPYVHPEEVSFVYDSITWEHEMTGVMAQDDWQAPAP